MSKTQHVEVSEKYIRIFELQAVKEQVEQYQGSQWYFVKEVTPEIRAIPFFQGKLDDTDMALIAIKPAAAYLDAFIENEIYAGKGFRIHHVQMSNHVAIVLYTEGRITQEHVAQKEEQVNVNGELYISLSGVFFAGRPYGVTIYSELSPTQRETAFATIDQFGNIV